VIVERTKRYEDSVKFTGLL